MTTKQLLKTIGGATLILLLHTAGYAQAQGDGESTDNDTARVKHLDEITIRHKGAKDAKMTVEIKNGEVFINGKPANDYKDDDVSISSRKIDGDEVYLYKLDGNTFNISPFRYKTDNYAWSRPMKTRKVTVNGGAFLGVTSLRPDNGPAGAKIGEISEGSAAEKAGLKEGDLITKLDDATIDDPADLSAAVRKHKPGDKVTITYTRGGKVQTATVELGKSKTSTLQVYGYDNDLLQNDLESQQREMEKQGRQMEELQRRIQPRSFSFGFDGGQPRLGIRAQDTEDGKGVKVLDVDDESAAAKAGIKEGDIITRFDGQDVNSATRLAELARVKKGDPARSSVKVDLLRAGKPMQVEVKTPRKLQTTDL